MDGISTISAGLEVVYFNRAGLKLVGYPPGQAFTPMPLSRFLVHPGHQEVLKRVLEVVAEKGGASTTRSCGA